MSILDQLIGFIAPHTCLGCRVEGAILCSACTTTLRVAPSVCYRCEVPTANYQTCDTCRTRSGINVVYAATRYEGLSKDLIWRLKFTGARAAAEVIATVMATDHPPLHKTLVIPIPTASKRDRQRGYDQAFLIAVIFACKTSACYTPLLKRSGNQRQRGASKLERAQQLHGVYRVNKNKVAGNDVILIDDVMTTGSTIEEAARCLRAAGVLSIRVAVFARV